MRIAVDTNVLVRYLTWDDEGQGIEATSAIEGAIIVPTIVLWELVWVLKRAYRCAGQEVIDCLRRLIYPRSGNQASRCRGRDRDARRGGDFADDVVRYEADRAKCDRIVTFERDFARLLNPHKVALLGTRSTA